MADATTDRSTVQTVIYFLGGIAVLLVLGSILLGYKIIGQAAKGSVDPVVIGILSTLSGLAGTALGALSAMLVSTRSTPVAEPENEGG